MDDASDSSFPNECAPSVQAESLRVLICVLTRRRPALLAEALCSVGQLCPVDCVSVECLVVENDSEPQSRSEVPVGDDLPVRFHYAHEPRIGIPFGRNRGVDYALESAFDFLAFFDDDETLDPQWLREMVEHSRAIGPGLVGGPVALRFPQSTRLRP